MTRSLRDFNRVGSLIFLTLFLNINYFRFWYVLCFMFDIYLKTCAMSEAMIKVPD